MKKTVFRQSLIRYCLLAYVAFHTIAVSQISYAQTRVKAQSLGSVQLVLESSIPATVISLRQVTVAAQLTTTVTEIPIKVGQIVAQNQIIAKLDCTDNRLTLEQSQAELIALKSSLELAEKQLARLNRLIENSNISAEQINQKQNELNTAQSRIKAREIAIEINKNQIEKCNIRAPFDGVISAKKNAIGDFVTPGKAIADIVDIDNIELQVNVTTDNLEQIEAASQLDYIGQDTTLPLSIRTLLPVFDEATQSRLMRLTFDNEKPLPGARGRLSWTLSGKTLPASLLVFRDAPGIFIVEQQGDNNIARFFPVNNARQGQPVEVDLPADILVITEGRFGLADNEEIVIE